MLVSQRAFYEFTSVSAANELLNDLVEFPHAFVLACVMDRQIKAERAWLIPYLVSEKIGEFTIRALSNLSESDIKRLLSKPRPLHRFVDVMSKNFYLAVQRIAIQYSGDAAKIWANTPSSAEVVYRFLEFDGVGPKIATMATNILARNFKTPMSDYSSVDVSADVHVRRVFGRLGLCSQDPTVDQVIYRARALYPSFPGIMDWPTYEIGRNWCRPNHPDCDACYMRDLCPTSLSTQV